MRQRRRFSRVKPVSAVRVMPRQGFTLTEMLLVLVIMGLMSMFGFRSTRDAVRSARLKTASVAASNAVALARAAAISRGCRAVFHVDQGAVAATWVTVCKTTAIGGTGTAVDTLGPVESLGTRYGVSVASTADSVQFDARGITSTYSSATFRLTGASSAQTDSFTVNAVGRVIR